MNQYTIIIIMNRLMMESNLILSSCLMGIEKEYEMEIIA